MLVSSEARCVVRRRGGVACGVGVVLVWWEDTSTLAIYKCTLICATNKDETRFNSLASLY